MKKSFNLMVVILSGLLLFSCAYAKEFVVPVVNYQGQQIKDTLVIIPPYGLFTMGRKVEGVKYRMRWQNVFPLLVAPVTTAGWYLVEPKEVRNYVVKQ